MLKVYLVLLVFFQVLSLFIVKDLSWPMVLLSMYFIGGTINHALMLGIHEISHNLAFGHSRPHANRLLGIFVNLPICLPFSVAFKGYHLEHHKYQGDEKLDTDIPTELEAKLFCTTFGKLVWMFFQPLFYTLRPLVTYPKKPTLMEAFNTTVQLSFNGLVIYYFGGKCFVYLLIGSVLAMGIHPVAGHFISEHYMFLKGFETYSYYGPLNLLTWNVGYHNEHHDFPFIPGSKLPKQMELAFYLGIFALLFGTIVHCQQCPSDYIDHPLVLVSMDGFRYDYLQRGLTPNINAFMQGGVSAPYMIPSFPTVTFANHYTIVTGLYPESHGIVANSFYDPVLNETFDIFKGDDNINEAKWWGGSPIWNTVVKQGKQSAACYWPGSDAAIENMHPTQYFPYNDTASDEDKVKQVLEWLAWPIENRPIWICVYFNEPDHTAHSYGPNSPEVNAQLSKKDDTFQSLIVGIAELGLTSCVNVILLADHGMADAGESRLIYIDDYIPEVNQMAKVWDGAFSGLSIYDQYADEKETMRENTTCQRPEYRQFVPESFPIRHHYSNNIRINDVVFDMDPGFSAVVKNDVFILQGQHGYDNYYKEMQPIFMAQGPDFLSGVSVEPFQNIELYNLMCTLVGVVPDSNNGTTGALYNLLKNPPQYPQTDSEIFLKAQFPTAQELPNLLGIAECAGDPTTPQPWVFTLNLTDEEMNASEALNLPWGIPLDLAIPVNLELLYHNDHITGFSQSLKMPLWTSFTLDGTPSGSPETDWSSDVRLTPSNTPTCRSYDDLLSANITMEPLFPRRYSDENQSLNIPYLVSNAVPMTSQLKGHWKNLVEDLLWTWNGLVNVVIGPLFDNDSDSLVDDLSAFTNTPVVPSDMFLVVTRCRDVVNNLQECSPASLDAVTFMYPAYNSVENCLSPAEYARYHMARVKDVELASGLTFFPYLSYQDQMALKIRIHSDYWYIP